MKRYVVVFIQLTQAHRSFDGEIQKKTKFFCERAWLPLSGGYISSLTNAVADKKRRHKVGLDKFPLIGKNEVSLPGQPGCGIFSGARFLTRVRSGDAGWSAFEAVRFVSGSLTLLIFKKEKRRRRASGGTCWKLQVHKNGAWYVPVFL